MHTISNIPESGSGTVEIRHQKRMGVLSGLEVIIGLVMLWRARSRQRRSLSKLDDRLLQDIGLTREAATQEAAKPFWRA